MATQQDGGVRVATDNTVTAMRRSAQKRQCPSCGRKSALKHEYEDGVGVTYCRWSDCGHESVRDHTEVSP